MGARDVSPRGGGLIHHVVAPQRRRQCGIAPAALLVCSLAAPDDNPHVSVCCGCADLGVGGGGASWRCCFELADFFACDMFTRELHVYFGLQERLQRITRRSGYAGFATQVAKPTWELRNVTRIIFWLPPKIMILFPATGDPSIFV